MQKTLISYTSFVALAFALFSLFGLAKHASAETYFVDVTGNGCDQSCQQLLSQYFSTNTNTSTASSSNGTSTSATSTAAAPSTWYPYQQYVNFETTNSYYNAGNQRYSPNGYNPYAYRVYTYFNNQTYTGYNSQPSYANQFYTYYGSDANDQLKKYQQATQPTYGTNTAKQYQTYVPQNTGFTMTSGF